MNLIDRQRYTSQIEQMYNKGLIIALTGQRRVGKSCVMQQLVSRLGSNNNIIYINKDQEQFSKIENHDDLTDYVTSRLVNDRQNFLFIDEVQNITEFEKSLRSFQNDDSCNIIVTGSNAHIFSSELSTFLSGRCIEYHIQSLDYKEFLEFHKLENTDESLRKYLDVGGMPQLHRFGIENIDLVDDYLSSVFNTIVLKDIVERENIRNVSLLKNLIRFVGDNIGKEISATSIAKFLKSERIDVSTFIILNYLEYLSNAYIINRVPRFDIHGKHIFETNAKYYFEDLGLRNNLSGHRHFGDIEKLIENAVYLHLKRCGYKVSVGVFRKAEIDFVAEKQNITVYVQATYLLASDETIAREFGNLEKIPDNYPKYVVSMDNWFNGSNHNGIIHLSLKDFLLKYEF